MTLCRFHHVNYELLAWKSAIRRVCSLLVVTLAVVPLVWLDEAKIQVIGFLLYPIECALNAVFFPDVTPPVRGNGTALLILAPTLALLAVAVAALRSVGAFVRGAFHRINRRVR